MWYLIGLAWIALIAGLIVMYKRKRRQRDAARADKMAALLADLKSSPAAGGLMRTATAPQAAPKPRPEFRKKPRLLPQPTALLYAVFRTGLPDHEIFAGLTLADVLDTATVPSLAEPAQVSKLLKQRLDLVVCTKQLEVVAGVIFSNSVETMRDGGADSVAQCLQAAQIRLVRIDPAAAPRHHQVRELIYGERA